MHVRPLLVLATALAMSGCTAFDSAVSEAELTYDGAGDGRHSDRTQCDAEGTLTGRGDIQDGVVELVVTDGDGTQMYRETFDGAFDLDRIRLDGDSGEWTLRAERDGDDLVGDQFSGEYGFFLDCEPL